MADLELTDLSNSNIQFVEGGPNWIPKLSSYIVSDSIWIRFRRDSLLLTDGSRMDQRASGRELLQLYE